MLCVTTRFRLHHVWTLLPRYLTFRAMRRDLAVAPGLVRFAFLIEGPHVCWTLSIWESQAALEQFSNVPRHIDAVRRAKRWCGDNIWSASWRLDSVSQYAHLGDVHRRRHRRGPEPNGDLLVRRPGAPGPRPRLIGALPIGWPGRGG